MNLIYDDIKGELWAPLRNAINYSEYKYKDTIERRVSNDLWNAVWLVVFARVGNKVGYHIKENNIL